MVDAQGQRYWAKAKMLKDLCRKLYERGRVARVVIEQRKEKAQVVELKAEPEAAQASSNS